MTCDIHISHISQQPVFFNCDGSYLNRHGNGHDSVIVDKIKMEHAFQWCRHLGKIVDDLPLFEVMERLVLFQQLNIGVVDDVIVDIFTSL